RRRIGSRRSVSRRTLSRQRNSLRLFLGSAATLRRPALLVRRRAVLVVLPLGGRALVHRHMLRCGERTSSAERDRGRPEQPKEDPLTCSRRRPPALPAGIRVRGATESCSKHSI